MNAVGRAAEERRTRGVIAQSTGNHAIAVGLAAREHGVRATLVLPSTAPEIKVAQCRASGARVVTAGADVDSRLEIERARSLAVAHQ